MPAPDGYIDNPDYKPNFFGPADRNPRYMPAPRSKRGGTTQDQPQGGGGGAGLIDSFTGGLSNLPYYNTPAFQSVVKGFTDDPGTHLVNSGNAQQWQQTLQGYASTFANQFKNLAGRDPTADEYNTFFSEVVAPAQPWNKTPDQSAIDQGATNVINKDFSSVINEAVQERAQGQADAALAPGSPFDQWQQSYMSSLNDTEKSLQDFQSRLFEKIRPQLLTSLQAQGLLNTGGLNDAFAGVAGDLTSGVQNYMAQARLNANQDINNRRFSIASAPSTASLQNTLNTVPNLTSAGQNALQNLWTQDANVSLANLNYQNQSRLLDQQNSSGPSLLSQFGGRILGGVAGGLVGGFTRGPWGAAAGATAGGS